MSVRRWAFSPGDRIATLIISLCISDPRDALVQHLPTRGHLLLRHPTNEDRARRPPAPGSAQETDTRARSNWSHPARGPDIKPKHGPERSKRKRTASAGRPTTSLALRASGTVGGGCALPPAPRASAGNAGFPATTRNRPGHGTGAHLGRLRSVGGLRQTRPIRISCDKASEVHRGPGPRVPARQRGARLRARRRGESCRSRCGPADPAASPKPAHGRRRSPGHRLRPPFGSHATGIMAPSVSERLWAAISGSACARRRAGSL
jgi:hypothetical protein